MTYSTSKRIDGTLRDINEPYASWIALCTGSSTSNYLNVPPHASSEQVDFSLYVVNTVHNKVRMASQ